MTNLVLLRCCFVCGWFRLASLSNGESLWLPMERGRLSGCSLHIPRKAATAAFQSSLVHGSSSCTLPILRQFRRRTWPFLTPRYEGAVFELSIFWRQMCGVIDKSCFAQLLFCFWMVSTGFLIKWGIGVAFHGARIDIRLTSSPSSSAATGCQAKTIAFASYSRTSQTLRLARRKAGP